MKKATKIIIAISSGVLAVSIAAFFGIYFTYLHRYKGKEVVDEWHENDIFDINTIQTLEKNKDKDFVILNLADVQMADLDDIFRYDIIHKEITYLVNEYQPDLITLTGDQTMSNENLVSLKKLISWLDEYKVPYAPIFGNHDYGNDFNSAVASREYCSDLYEAGKYSLYKRGPTNLSSLGNYAINILEDNKVITTLYMLDLGYNKSLTEEQKSWFDWTARGIKEANDNISPRGMVFTHKDFKEHYQAYHHYLENPESAEGKVYVHDGFAYVDNGSFVEMAKFYGVTDFVCGHEHGNNFTINYAGARYTFAVKTSETCYIYEDEEVYMSGGTEICINKEKASFYHHFVDRNSYRFS